MTAAPAQLAGERGDVRFVHQSMYYPVTDDAMDTGSYEQFAESYFPTAKAMAWAWEAGICSGGKERHPQRLDGIQRGRECGGQQCRNHMKEVARATPPRRSLRTRGGVRERAIGFRVAHAIVEEEHCRPSRSLIVQLGSVAGRSARTAAHLGGEMPDHLGLGA